MDTLIQFNPLRIALVVGSKSTDVVVIDASGNPAYHLVTIHSTVIELHDGHLFEADLSKIE